jgi:deoxyribodipyrimidine photo-lyase
MLNVFWFRKDLRLEDNTGLKYFISKFDENTKFSFLYIKNPESYQYYGEKRITFLLNSLKDLKANLNKFGLRLQIFEGVSSEIFSEIIKKYSRINVYANGQVEPYSRKRDVIVKDIIEKSDGTFNLYSDTTLFDLNQIIKDNGEPYLIFTPFKNKFLKNIQDRNFDRYKINLNKLSPENQINISLNCKYYLNKKDNEDCSNDLFQGGSKEAIQLLSNFCKKKISDYRLNRDFPSLEVTSFLSPHIHFGTISIRECFQKAIKAAGNFNNAWINELIWREFYYNITYNFPNIIHQSFKNEYDNIIWSYNEKLLSNWKDGLTGYPIVDAGMRQLNDSGWMHNRLRMITAMFLTKDLFMDWRLGEKYFAEKLIDLDFSSNNGGWQWSASTGCDSQPYFRIFNPEIQSRKYDPEGKYIKKFVPELKNLPIYLLHNPSNITKSEEIKYNFTLGHDYPAPIINHQKAKERTIKIFKQLKNH